MNDVFVLIASALCLIIGLCFCWPPIERYRRVTSVGAFGSLLVVCGVVLMTTFKWTEVAIKFSELEVKLAEAESRAEKLQISLAERESDLTRVYSAATTEGQKKSVGVFLSVIAEASDEPVKWYMSKDVRKALDDGGLTILPKDVIPNYAVFQDNLKPTGGG